MIANSIPLTAYFPDCCLPGCNQYFDCTAVDITQQHQHILPVQHTIINSTAKYHYMQGGVGGGKSDGFAARCVQLSLQYSKNKGVVARHNLDDLYDSSWRKVNACLVNLAERNYIPNPTFSKKVSGQYTEVLLHNGSEIKAVHGKNWRRGLGADHGWFWVDDALECLEEFFIGEEISAGLLSRLRLPHIRFAQGCYDAATRNHGALHGMISSNPPAIGHWLHKLFGSKPGLYMIGEDTVEWTIGQTADNPFTGAGYAKGIMAVQAKLGRSADVAKRVIFGESIPAYGGIKVFPQFDESRHVTIYKYNKDIPIIASYDFGFLHPAVTFSHLYKCQYDTNHYITIGEIADAMSVNVYKLQDSFVVPYIKERFGDCCLMLYAGDRAGWRKSSSSRDNRGDMRILVDEYHLPFKHRVLDLTNSLQFMRGLLDPKKPCKCGMELILVDQLHCPVLIAALQGGCKYSKSRDGKISDKPVADRYFEDVADAWRYGAENYVKWGIPEQSIPGKQQQTQPFISPFAGQNPWQWMELTDTQMGQMLKH